jgi:hypothetical protein
MSSPQPQGRPPLLIFVDDPKTSGPTLKRVFDGLLGRGLSEGDSGLRTDLYHWIEKECDTWAPGHSSHQSAKSDLYKTLLTPDNDDLSKYLAWKGTKGNEADHVRKYIPKPDILLQRFEAWVTRWSTVLDLKGRCLFTEETMKMHVRNREDISNWLLSGELMNYNMA